MNEKIKKSLKIIIIVLFMIIGTFQGLFFYVNSIVQPESYEAQILDAIKKQSGQDVTIKGGVRFSLLPVPRLVMNDLIIGAKEIPESSIETPVFYIRNVKIDIALGSILSDKIILSNIQLDAPTLLLQRSEDNNINWDWLNIKLLNSLSAKNADKISLPVSIYGGSLRYTDLANNKNIVIENIQANSTFGAEVVFNGSMQAHGNTYKFVINNSPPESGLKEAESPINLVINDPLGSALKIETLVDSTNDTPTISGKFDFASNDINSFVDLFKKQDANDSKKETELPIQLLGGWKLEDGIIKMQDLVIDGMNSKGGGTASIAWNKWYPTISLNLDLESIDYLLWKKFINQQIFTKKQTKSEDEFEEDAVQNYDFRKENPLPENIELRLEINTKKVIFGKEEWKNTYLSAILSNGTFTINQCDLTLDGEGSLTIFGVVSQGGTGELRFEGNVEAVGKSLRKAITTFYSSAKDLPPISLGEFNARANMYITAGQIRLFETEGTIEGVNLTGTITIFLESVLRIDSAIKLTNVNFDSIRDELRKQKAENINKKDKKSAMSFDWLKYLSIRFDTKVIIDGFTFMEKQGSKATFSLYAYRGDLRISDLQLQYSELVDTYNVNLDVRGKQPFINLMINVDKIDTNYFKLDQPTEDTAIPAISENTELLSKENLVKAVPLEWMEEFNGVFDFSINSFVHKNLAIDRIKLQAKLDNKRLTIQKLGFVFSQAQTYITGTIYGGRVPGMNISFTMSNADIYEVVYPVTGLDNISGFANLSGNVNTSGWNYMEWLQNSDSSLLVSARGVKVQGINLEGVSSVIDIARSSADVYNNVNNILTKGATEFSVDGAFNIREGELRAPSITLKSGLITGSFIGGLKLENLEGQFSSNFRFSNISSSNAPTMIIQLAGNMKKPEIKVDTATLEAYVAKRNVIQ